MDAWTWGFLSGIVVGLAIAAECYIVLKTKEEKQ